MPQDEWFAVSHLKVMGQVDREGPVAASNLRQKDKAGLRRPADDLIGQVTQLLEAAIGKRLACNVARLCGVADHQRRFIHG